MTLLVAQNLNASSNAFASAVMAGDAAWIREEVSRLVATGVDALDLCLSSVAPDVETESTLLDRVAQLAESVSALPLFLDSSRAQVLLRSSWPRRCPPVLNSVAVDEWPKRRKELRLPEQSGVRWVVQLRRGRTLPVGLADRLTWTQLLVDAMHSAGISFEEVWVDPVTLPWGEDFDAGDDLLRFVEVCGHRWPGLRTLLAVGNLSWGHPGRARLHREWILRLKEHGAQDFLLDPTEPGVVDLARR